MWGKVVKMEYFQEQDLEVFLEKFKAQGWLDLFANAQMECSLPYLAEVYANCVVTQGVVSSSQWEEIAI